MWIRIIWCNSDSFLFIYHLFSTSLFFVYYLYLSHTIYYKYNQEEVDFIGFSLFFLLHSVFQYHKLLDIGVG